MNKRIESRIIKDGFPPAARGVLAVDFDGTLFHFDSPGGMMGDKVEHTGAGDFVRAAKAAGWTIAIFTSRLSPTWWEAEGWNHDEARARQYQYCIDQLELNNIPFDLVTCEKLPATYYIDDRAIEFAGDWLSIRERVLGKGK